MTDLSDLLERLKEALKPDEDLDRAVREFSYLYFELADEIALARNARQEHKDVYDKVYAQEKVRLLEGPEKISISLADTKCELVPAVRKKKAILRRVEQHLERLEALMKSFEKKSSMLKAEVELVASSYSQRDHIRPRTERLRR